MKITSVDLIEFRTITHSAPTRWGYGAFLGDVETRDAVTALFRISTDDGVDGYMLGGDRAMLNVVRPLLLGENPLDREKIWHWLDQLVTFSHALDERQAGVVDCALWDLAGRMTGLPVSNVTPSLVKSTVKSAMLRLFPNARTCC